ncbi:probable BOI-related E3 ubiquitin-protein ligase 3 [Phalaenopsis equestris]|uniref:probable BOI-related E3 ubiquitin-protein ligase 3 n=1 Tax=Phalaenopsis equestris TaxID=78828 RepID=UPI0009E47A1D|nr:probable BOI-related E3 ubiquitin-protein ligase 3 [Phalaenopsis equestris]
MICSQNRELAEFPDSKPPAMLGNSHTGLAPPLAAPSESGITISGGLPFYSKKRPRDPLSFLGEDLFPCFQQQMLDLDRLLLHHTERMRLEITERRRRFSRQLMAAMEDGISKRLKAKEDEIERMRKLNWAMEERIRTLSVENEIWKELAQTNEATANLLRTNLEQILTSQIRIKEEQRLVDEASPADDAESCWLMMIEIRRRRRRMRLRG